MRNAQHRITESFRALLCSRDFDDITVTELCRMADITRKTFYTYFRDKHDVIEHIFSEEVISPAIKRLDNGAANFPDLVTGIFSSILNSKAFYKRAARVDGQNSFLDIALGEIQRLVESVFAVLGRSKNEYVVYACAASLTMTILKWIKDDMRIAPEKMAELMYPFRDRGALPSSP